MNGTSLSPWAWAGRSKVSIFFLAVIVYQLSSRPRAPPSPAFTFPFTDGYAPYYHGWADIPREDVRTLTAAKFVTRYVLQRRPVILTGVGLSVNKTALSIETLRAECGHMPVDTRNHYLRAMKAMNAMPGLLRALNLRQWLAGRKLPMPLSDITSLMDTDWTLETFMRFTQNQQQQQDNSHRAADEWYQTIWEYLWPMTVHGSRVGTMHTSCPLLSKAASDMAPLLGNILPGIDVDNYIQHKSELYLAPVAGTRAYPLHQHGDLNDTFLIVLTGAKRVAVFPPTEDKHLDEQPLLRVSEYSDRAFSADPLNVRTKMSAGLRLSRGAEGVVQGGEAIYIPFNSIHIVENVRPSLALALHVGNPIMAPVLESKTGTKKENTDNVMEFSHELLSEDHSIDSLESEYMITKKNLDNTFFLRARKKGELKKKLEKLLFLLSFKKLKLMRKLSRDAREEQDPATGKRWKGWERHLTIVEKLSPFNFNLGLL